MNAIDAIDGTEHVKTSADGPPPSLLTLIFDTNPLAWSALSSTLPLTTVLSNLLVFINAHLSFSHENQVAVVASYVDRAEWLYPTPVFASAQNNTNSAKSAAISGEHEVVDSNANKYRPFALVEAALVRNIRKLLDNVGKDSQNKADDIDYNSSYLAGALTLALSYINKAGLTSAQHTSGAPHASSLKTAGASSDNATTSSGSSAGLTSRVLIVSTSGALAGQYISIMNGVFAAQHSGVMIDILKLSGDAVLLQQASYTTHGTFLQPSLQHIGSAKVTKSESILQLLLQAFLPDATARRWLQPLSTPQVDFRAACFCHQKVIDIGWVCSICLSIFCEPPAGGICLTCGTKLRVEYRSGSDITAVLGGPDGSGVIRKKKKKKRLDEGTPAASGSEA